MPPPAGERSPKLKLTPFPSVLMFFKDVSTRSRLLSNPLSAPPLELPPDEPPEEPPPEVEPPPELLPPEEPPEDEPPEEPPPEEEALAVTLPWISRAACAKSPSADVESELVSWPCTVSTLLTEAFGSSPLKAIS